MSPCTSPSTCTSPFDSRLPVMERSAPMSEAPPELPAFARGAAPARALCAPDGGLGDGMPGLAESDGEPSLSGLLVNISPLLRHLASHPRMALNTDRGIRHRRPSLGQLALPVTRW